MYLGEAEIKQVESFLNSAKVLEVRGITTDTGGTEEHASLMEDNGKARSVDTSFETEERSIMDMTEGDGSKMTVGEVKEDLQVQDIKEEKIIDDTFTNLPILKAKRKYQCVYE